MGNEAKETKSSTLKLNEDKGDSCGCAFIAFFFLLPGISGNTGMADNFISLLILTAVGTAVCVAKKTFLRYLILLLSAAAALYFMNEAWALPLLLLTTAMGPFVSSEYNAPIVLFTGLMMGIALWFADEALWTIPFFILPVVVIAVISSRTAFWNLLLLGLTLSVSGILWYMHDTCRAILFFCWAGMEFFSFTPLIKWGRKIYYYPGLVSFAAAGYLWTTDEIGPASVLFILTGLLATMGRTYQNRKKLREEERKQSQPTRSVKAMPQEIPYTFLTLLFACLVMGWCLLLIDYTFPLSISSMLLFLVVFSLTAFFSSENLYLTILLLVIAISASGIFDYMNDDVRAGFLFVWAFIELMCIKPAITHHKEQKRIKDRNKAIAELIATLRVHAEKKQSELHKEAE